LKVQLIILSSALETDVDIYITFGHLFLHKICIWSWW